MSWLKDSDLLCGHSLLVSVVAQVSYNRRTAATKAHGILQRSL